MLKSHYNSNSNKEWMIISLSNSKIAQLGLVFFTFWNEPSALVYFLMAEF